MTIDLVIKNGTIVTPVLTYQAHLLIDGGRFVAIVSDASLPPAREVIDADSLHVLPGIIDGHVHFRDPGLTYKEDFGTGTLAAAYGGVTTIVDMPNTVPPTSCVKVLREKIEIASSKALIDFGLTALILQDDIDEILSLAEAGVVGYKVFMAESVGNLPHPDDGVLLEAFELVGKTNLRCCVHAENSQIVFHLGQKLKDQGRTDPLAHLEARPSLAEAEAIQRAILLAREAKSKLHIYHLSTKEGVELVEQAKKRGQDVTAETCPHFLLFESGDMERLGTILKVNPPVREEEDRETLWQGLSDGRLDMIATDHGPHALEEKIKDSIWEAAAGFVGVEVGVPLMLTEVSKGRMTLNRYVQVASENPARAWGLYPQKGRISVGADADLTIVDLSQEGIIKAESLHSKNKVTPYNGRKVKGMPVYTIVRGMVVMRKGQVVVGANGRLVSPRRL